LSDDLLEGVDVNSPEGFSAALGRLVEAQAPEAPAVEEPAATEESAPEGQPRTALGQFAKLAAETPEVPQEGAASPAAQEETYSDPEVAALLARYGGNVEAALKEAAGAQSVIGRQGNELGELRSRLEQIESKVEAPAPTPEREIPIPGAASPEREALEDFVAENGGEKAMRWVVDNRPELINTALELWAEEDPVPAAAFAGRMAAFEAAQQFQAQQPAVAQPDPAKGIEEGLAKAVSTVKAERSDWSDIQGHLDATLEDPNNSLIAEAVVSSDPNRQLQGVRALANLARARALADATAQATQTASETATAAKQGAWVASGSLRPASEGQPESPGASKEAAISDFQKRILDAGTTSVLGAMERQG
jgi:hypothetical protein